MRRESCNAFEMPVEVRYIVETGLEANYFSWQFVLHQRPAYVRDANFGKELEKRFVRHELEIAAKRSC